MENLKEKCTIPKSLCNARDKDGYCKLGVGNVCQPIIEQCEGCKRIDNGYCSVYINPKVKWSHDKKCPLASHLIILVEESQKGKSRIGQQKHKKTKK